MAEKQLGVAPNNPADAVTLGLVLSPRGGNIGSSATPLSGVDLGYYKDIAITALATAITNMSTGAGGTMTRGMTLTITIKDNGTPRAINWGTLFMAGPAALLTTTVAGKTHASVFRFDPDVGNKLVCFASDPVGY